MQRGHGPCRHKSPGTECKVGERQDETQRPRGHISGALLFLVARPRARRLCEGHYPLRPLAHVAACVPLGVAPCATLSRARRTLAQPREGAPVPLACAAVPGTACLRCAIRQEERTTKHTSSGPCRTPYQSTRRRDYVVRLQNDAPSGPVLLRGAVTYDEPGGQALGRSSGAGLYAARALRLKPRLPTAKPDAQRAPGRLNHPAGCPLGVGLAIRCRGGVPSGTRREAALLMPWDGTRCACVPLVRLVQWSGSVARLVPHLKRLSPFVRMAVGLCGRGRARRTARVAVRRGRYA
jgi:hypothetical protein